MGLIKSDRQLAISRKRLHELRAGLKRLASKYRGAKFRGLAGGPTAMIEQLENEIREYGWLRKATPAQVLRRFPLVRMEEVGQYLARLRIASVMSQEELARRVGCKQPDIARLEDADYQGHTARTLKAVAEALDVEILIGARTVGRPKRVG